MALLTFPWSQLLDSSGNTYPGAKLYFYETGTSTLASTYTDAALTTAHANPVVADAQGVFAPIYLASKKYKAVLKTSADVTLFSADPIDGGATTNVATIAAMTAISAPTNGLIVVVAEEKRGGLFVFDTSVAAAGDGGTTFSADDATTGSWVRQYSGPADIRWFGAVGDTVTDDTAAIAAAVASGLNIYIPPLNNDNRFLYDGAVLEMNGSITSSQSMIGEGWQSAIEFQSGGIAWTGAAGKHKLFRGLRLIASGTAQTLLDLSGSTEAQSVTRWVIDTIFLKNENAAGGNRGMRIRGGWIGAIYSPIIQGFDNDGIEVTLSGGTPNVAFNNLNIYGGEIQGNRNGLAVDGTLGLSFFGTAIEGNNQNGVLCANTTRGMLFSGCYFEANGLANTSGANDVRIEADSALSSIYSITFDNCTFLSETGSDNAIYANVCKGLYVHPNNAFVGYVYNVYLDQLGADVITGSAHKGSVSSASTAHIFNNTNRFGEMRETVHSLGETAAADATTTACPDALRSLTTGAANLGDIEIAMTCTDAGDVRLRVEAFDLSTGSQLGTDLDFTHTATAGRNFVTSAWNFGSRGMEGKDFAVVVSRLGSDAADTNTGTVTFSSVRVRSYEVDEP